MPRKLTIDPVTRIEGHARVELDIDDTGTVTNSVFKVMDFRGFEKFLQGMQVEMMPTVTSRICGTCPQTHHLAAVRAVDKVFGVTPPRAADLIRNVMNLGAMVHSHAVHFFGLAAPDLLMGLDADPASRNIIGLVKANPELAKKALRLRSIGQRIVELTGGRGTHPVSCIPGGVAAPLTKENGERIKKLVAEGVPLGQELFNTAKEALTSKPDLVQALPLETHYLGTVKNDAVDFYDGELRLRGPDGQSKDFAEDDWKDHLFEEAISTSYAKYVFCQTGQEGEDAVPYRVGPLARINCADKIDTPLAQAEFEQFRQLGGSPCHQTVMYHYARLIELLHSLEKLAALVADPELYSENVRTACGSPRNGTAHVEAPRGVLIHDYEVDDNAIVTKANLIVATQQNTPAINATVGMAAQQFLDQPDAVMLNAVEFGIRCYDPCLSCATHRVGEMHMEIVIRQGGEILRRVRR